MCSVNRKKPVMTGNKHLPSEPGRRPQKAASARSDAAGQNLSRHPEVIRLKERQKDEVHAFANEHIFWAYNDRDFDEGMKKLGLESGDTDQIIGIAGGVIRRDMVPAYRALIERQEKELKELKKFLRSV